MAEAHTKGVSHMGYGEIQDHLKSIDKDAGASKKHEKRTWKQASAKDPVVQKGKAAGIGNGKTS